jgi:hypothetical protein
LLSPLKSPPKKRNGFTFDEVISLKSDEDLMEIDFLCHLDIAMTFNTNVLRIALNMQEEKVASLIIAFYHFKLDSEMILRAEKTAQLNFL